MDPLVSQVPVPASVKSSPVAPWVRTETVMPLPPEVKEKEMGTGEAEDPTGTTPASWRRISVTVLPDSSAT